MTEFGAYDFKGNLPWKKRWVIKDSEILSVFIGPPTNWEVPAYRVDWTGLSESTLLETDVYETAMVYDGLSRPISVEFPLDQDSERKLVVPTYNRSGAMETISLDGDMYVSRIAYNAKGQRVLMAYGNGVMTRFAYDPVNFRLLRQRSERFEIPSGFPLTYEAQSGSVKQDCEYTFDLSGNIVGMSDESPNAGFNGAATLDREFTYDALYRLLTASGREAANYAQSSHPSVDYQADTSHQNSREYTRTYTYDMLGNMLKLNHSPLGGPSFNRWFNDYDVSTTAYHTSNLASKVKYGSWTIANSFDGNGNMISEGSSRHFEWDFADQMRVYRTQTGTSEPTVYAHYLYDAGGVRVKKIVRKSTGNHEVSIYIDGVFEYLYEVTSSSTRTEEMNEIHVMDGRSRIARREVFGSNWSGSTSDPVKYVMEDHLGNASFTLTVTGTTYSREEYFPFGETSFGSYGKKRYRFCGKERDEESGLYYYGARYYMPWQCRFVSVDPLAAEYVFYTPYQYASNKPIVAIDLDGLETPEEQNTGMEADGQGNNPYEGMEQFADQPVMSQDNIPSGEIPEHELDQHIPNYNIEGITITAKVDKNGPRGTTRNYKQEGTPDLATGVDLYTYEYGGVNYHIRSYHDYSSADWSQKKWEFSASETPGEGDWSEFHPNEYNFQDALVIAVEKQKMILDATYWYCENVVLPVMAAGLEGIVMESWMLSGQASIGRRVKDIFRKPQIASKSVEHFKDVKKAVNLNSRISKSGMSNREAGDFFGWTTGKATKGLGSFSRELLESNGWTKDVLESVASGYLRLAYAWPSNPSALYRAEQLIRLLIKYF